VDGFVELLRANAEEGLLGREGIGEYVGHGPRRDARQALAAAVALENVSAAVVRAEVGLAPTVAVAVASRSIWQAGRAARHLVDRTVVYGRGTRAWIGGRRTSFRRRTRVLASARSISSSGRGAGEFFARQESALAACVKRHGGAIAYIVVPQERPLACFQRIGRDDGDLIE
jgi:hypothetical protein